MEYTAPGQRVPTKECVQDLNPLLLRAVLAMLRMQAEADPEAAKNMKPPNMALVSPRVFWGVRAG